MIETLQYISDLRETDALGTAIDEFLSVCVIPVETDRPAPIMSTVKIKVLLPLDREMFLIGTVIMHRPDGFLVQLDCGMDLNFVKQTLLDSTVSESGGHHRRDESHAQTGPRAEEPLATPRVEAPRSSLVEPIRPAWDNSAGRVQGKVNITERIKVIDVPRESARDIERNQGREATSPGIQKPRPVKEPPAPRRAPEPVKKAPEPAKEAEEDFTISSISAVDAVTGRPIHTASQPTIEWEEPKSAGHGGGKSSADLESEFARHPASGSKEKRKTIPPQEVTRKFFSPDILEKARTESWKDPAVSELIEGSAPVDELFSLATEAGAIDIADSGLLEIPPAREKTSPSAIRPAEVTKGSSESTSPYFRRPAEVTRGGPESTRPQFRRPTGVVSQPAPEEAAAVEQSAPAADDAPDPAIEPENRELAVRIREMTTPEKQKLARQGRRVARRILIRDNDKTIHKFVMFNPEVQLDEVIEYTRWNGLAADAIEFITTNRAWIESREVILNIVRNPSTPIEIAVRYVIKLSPNEWRMFVRPGVVRPPVMNQARKLLLESEKKS